VRNAESVTEPSGIREKKGRPRNHPGGSGHGTVRPVEAGQTLRGGE
jgi:hypothetical protein